MIVEKENENDDGDCLSNLLKEFYEKNEAYYEENKAAIVYAIIKNHSDTQESLHLDELNFVIDFDLNLTSFTADDLYCDTIMSILKYSSKSLERFTWCNETWETTLVTFPELKLKEFSSIDVDPELIALVVRSCASTLTVLSINSEDLFNSITEMEGIDLSLPTLKLKIFEAVKCQRDLFISIIKSCSSSLEELKCETIFESNKYNSNFLNALPYLFKIKVFTAVNLEISILKPILKLSGESLTELKLRAGTSGTGLHNFSSPKLMLRKLQCDKISKSIVASILTQSAATLQELELNNTTFHFIGGDIPNLNITKLRCDSVNAATISLILNSSSNTLKHLKISNDKDQISRLQRIDAKLNLQSFQCDGISPQTFNIIINAQDSGLQHLVIEKVGCRRRDTVDPELITSLLKVKVDNPGCLIFVKNNKKIVSISN